MNKSSQAEAGPAVTEDTDPKERLASTEIVPNEAIAGDLANEFDVAAQFVRFYGKAIPVELDNHLRALVREVEAILGRDSVPVRAGSPLLIANGSLFRLRSALQSPIEGVSSSEEQGGILTGELQPAFTGDPGIGTPLPETGPLFPELEGDTRPVPPGPTPKPPNPKGEATRNLEGFVIWKDCVANMMLIDSGFLLRVDLLTTADEIIAGTRVRIIGALPCGKMTIPIVQATQPLEAI